MGVAETCLQSHTDSGYETQAWLSSEKTHTEHVIKVEGLGYHVQEFRGGSLWGTGSVD